MPDTVIRIDRRQILQAISAMVPGFVILSACGDRYDRTSELFDDDYISGRIVDRHGHKALLPRSQLDRTNELVLDITGTADHPHSITLSSPQLHAIAGGTQISVVSTLDSGHTHRVTFN